MINHNMQHKDKIERAIFDEQDCISVGVIRLNTMKKALLRLLTEVIMDSIL